MQEKIKGGLEPDYGGREHLPQDCGRCGADLSQTPWDEDVEDYEVEPGRFKSVLVMMRQCPGCGRVEVV